jgi:sialic acid synthase SpsE
MKIKITENRYVGSGEAPYIIAELGSNHNGDMDIARQLIDSAKMAGADCVKFQSWSKDTIFSKIKYEENHFLADDYRNRDDYTLEGIVDKFAITETQLVEMSDYCKMVGIDFTSTPFSKKEVDFLVDQLKVGFVKIASMDLNNYQFLDYIAHKGKPIVLSTGLSNLSEIDKAVRTIENAGNKQLIILHCVAIYPPEDCQINLNNLDSLSTIYPYPIGFSDHTLGTCIPLASVAKGACIVEKHFTLDKEMFGWDHKVSANEEDMLVITEGAKRIHTAMGNGRIEQVEERERLESFRRSIVAAKPIKAGEIIEENMLDYKRPSTGLEPEEAKYIVGKVAKRDISSDELIMMSDF